MGSQGRLKAVEGHLGWAAPGPCVAVVGGAAVDIIGQNPPLAPREGEFGEASKRPGRVSVACGGVGRNVAEALVRLGLHNTSLLSAVGRDPLGGVVRSNAELVFGSAGGLEEVEGERTAVFNAFLDSETGDMSESVSDFSIFDRYPSPTYLETRFDPSRLQAVVIDVNLHAQGRCTMARLLSSLGGGSGGPLVVANTVSLAKCERVGELLPVTNILIANAAEAARILKVFGAGVEAGRPASLQETADLALSVMGVLPRDDRLRAVVVTNGSVGAGLGARFGGQTHSASCPAERLPPDQVVSATGAGDCFLAGFLASLLSPPAPATRAPSTQQGPPALPFGGLDHWIRSLDAGCAAGARSVRSSDAVPATLGPLPARRGGDACPP